jgi:cytochrome c oxidase subunit 1
MSDGQTDAHADNVSVETSDGIGVQELSAAALAGFAGLVAMAPVFVVAWLLDALELSSFTALSEIVALGENSLIGVALFVAGGVVTFPLLFVSLAVFLPGRSVAEKGVSFGIIVWTGFLIAFYSAQTGATFAAYLVLTLLAHAVYGGVLGAVYGRFADVPVYQV